MEPMNTLQKTAFQSFLDSNKPTKQYFSSHNSVEAYIERKTVDIAISTITEIPRFSD